ncbi:MAG TPA: hypothetical protein VN329_08210, partial [Roseomonas sp.]|nr:hypothetical protein [Roseomonas sp.]
MRTAAAGFAVIITGVAAGTALACAPSPEEAAERFLTAIARCDFVAAWDYLAPSERSAFRQGVVGWSDREAYDASERIGCRAIVERTEVEGGATGERAIVLYVLAEPVVVTEFRRLLNDREVARVEDW